MQQGNHPPNPYQSSPPFAPKAVPFSPYSPGFLHPKNPRFWQPYASCSTPRYPGDNSNFSKAPPGGYSPSNSPHGSNNSDPHYIPLNNSQESSPAGQRGNGWSPKWRGRDGSGGSYQRYSSPRYNQNAGYGRFRGRQRNMMNSGSPQGWQRSPNQSHQSSNIQNYVSPSCLQDPWAELAAKQEDPPSTES